MTDLSQQLGGVDMNQTVDGSAVSMITAGGILLLSVLIVMTVVIFKRWHGRFMPMLLGAVSYAIFVFIFSNLGISALALIPSFDTAFENNPTSRLILYCILCAVGITIARVLVSMMLKERYERQGDVMLGGMGIGFGDALLYGMTAITNTVLALGVNNAGLESLLSTVDPADLVTTYESSFEPLFQTPALSWLICGVGASMDIVMSVLLMMVVFGAMKNCIPRIWILGSGIAQCLIFMPLQVVALTSTTGVMVAFLVKLVLFIAMAGYVSKVLVKEIVYVED
ncbi:MAG: hypothetical protein PHW47_02050 [Lachnospira sp.]|nr:hypothetical protein [Lachnospira sp.]